MPKSHHPWTDPTALAHCRHCHRHNQGKTFTFRNSLGPGSCFYFFFCFRFLIGFKAAVSSVFLAAAVFDGFLVAAIPSEFVPTAVSGGFPVATVSGGFMAAAIRGGARSAIIFGGSLALGSGEETVVPAVILILKDVSNYWFPPVLYVDIVRTPQRVAITSIQAHQVVRIGYDDVSTVNVFAYNDGLTAYPTAYNDEDRWAPPPLRLVEGGAFDVGWLVSFQSLLAIDYCSCSHSEIKENFNDLSSNLSNKWNYLWIRWKDDHTALRFK